MIMKHDEENLFELLNIIHELEYDSLKEIADYETCIEKLFYLTEGYFGYKSEIENFCIDDYSGEPITHTKNEYNKFIEEFYKVVLKTFVEKTDVGKLIYKNGYFDGEYEAKMLYEDDTDEF